MTSCKRWMCALAAELAGRPPRHCTAGETGLRPRPGQRMDVCLQPFINDWCFPSRAPAVTQPSGQPSAWATLHHPRETGGARGLTHTGSRCLLWGWLGSDPESRVSVRHPRDCGR